jgi:hypothetical protein
MTLWGLLWGRNLLRPSWILKAAGAMNHAPTANDEFELPQKRTMDT